MQFRIGDRDPVTGLYDVIWPDGSITRNGLKTFNAAHQTGDVMLATRRSDGLITLDSVKAADARFSIASSSLVEPPIGYLQGQVFNREEEKKKVPEHLTIRIAAYVRNVTLFDPIDQPYLVDEDDSVSFVIIANGNVASIFENFTTSGNYPDFMPNDDYPHGVTIFRANNGDLISPYELQIFTKKWPDNLQIYCLVRVDGSAAPVDDCAISIAQSDTQKPLPYNPAISTVIGSGAITKVAANFSATPPNVAAVILPPSVVAFVVTYSSGGGVSVA